MAVLEQETSTPTRPPEVAAPFVAGHGEADACDLGATLAWYVHGRGDPTTRLERAGHGRASAGRFTRATLTPEGPGTLHLRWSAGRLTHVEGWGPGGAWLTARAGQLCGADDAGADHLLDDEHPVVAAACRARRAVRHGRSGTLYHELLPTVIEQRITGVEAKAQWARLCRELGEPAPGPVEGLRLPPAPEVLARTPTWSLHPLGIERSRARALVEVARHAAKLWAWAEGPPSEAGRLLGLLPGIGVWTIGCVLGPGLGDTDAVPVGDYHVKNVIAFNLAGEPRATDERMLELLAPYAGQRGRVVRHVLAHGRWAPKYGPKQRILPMARW